VAVIARVIVTAAVVSVVVGIVAVVAGFALDDQRLFRVGVVVLFASAVGHVAIGVLALGYATPQTVPGRRVLPLYPPLLLAMVTGFHALLTRHPASLPAALTMFVLLVPSIGVVMSDPPRWRRATPTDGLDGPRRPPSWCTYRPALWRAQTRAGPVLLVGGYLVTPLVAVTWAATVFGWPAAVADRLDVAVTVSAVTVAVTAVLATSIALVSRPRSLVSPHLRDEPGLLAEPSTPDR
jgi:hypothetical protein